MKIIVGLPAPPLNWHWEFKRHEKVVRDPWRESKVKKTGILLMLVPSEPELGEIEAQFIKDDDVSLAQLRESARQVLLNRKRNELIDSVVRAEEKGEVLIVR